MYLKYFSRPYFIVFYMINVNLSINNLPPDCLRVFNRSYKFIHPSSDCKSIKSFFYIFMSRHQFTTSKHQSFYHELIQPSVQLLIYPSIHSSVVCTHSFLYLSIFISIHLSIYHFILPSICQHIHNSVRIHPFISLSLPLPS